MTPEKEAKNRIKHLSHIKRLGEYRGTTQRVTFKCVTHDLKFKSTYTALSDMKRKGCALCANRGTQNVPIEKRFMVNVKKTKTCWIWTGATIQPQNLYGAFFAPEYGGKAHRVSYAIFNGDYDKSLHVLHKCDNPICVNPNHLFLGTNKDNVDDRESKDRNIVPKGAHNGNSKISNLQAKYILIYGLYKKKKLELSKLPGKRSNYTTILSKKFNISATNVADIVNRKIWPTLNKAAAKFESQTLRENKLWLKTISQKLARKL